MSAYLIDTNIVIFYMKGKFNLIEKFDNIPAENLFISEITLAELKFGIANSSSPKKNKKVLDNFLTGVKVLPIYHSLDLFAEEKARLRKNGITIDDFDLLIGVTSVHHQLKMVTITSNILKKLKISN